MRAKSVPGGQALLSYFLPYYTAPVPVICVLPLSSKFTQNMAYDNGPVSISFTVSTRWVSAAEGTAGGRVFFLSSECSVVLVPAPAAYWSGAPLSEVHIWWCNAQRRLSQRWAGDHLHRTLRADLTPTVVPWQFLCACLFTTHSSLVPRRWFSTSLTSEDEFRPRQPTDLLHHLTTCSHTSFNEEWASVLGNGASTSNSVIPNVPGSVSFESLELLS